MLATSMRTEHRRSRRSAHSTSFSPAHKNLLPPKMIAVRPLESAASPPVAIVRMGPSANASMAHVLRLMLMLKHTSTDLAFTNPIHTSSNNSSTTTTMATQEITLDQIEAARAAYRAHLERVEAEDQGIIPQPRNETVDVAAQGIVIARDVTAEAVAAIPREWLEGLDVDHRDDGTLVLEFAASSALERAVCEVMGSVWSYASANGLEAAGRCTYVLQQGEECRADVSIHECTGRNRIHGQPFLVIFKVELTHRSVPRIIDWVIDCFGGFDDVQRVVVFKFYVPRSGSPRREHVCIPVLVLVFERDGGFVRVRSAKSFGNDAIPPSVIDYLLTPPAQVPLIPFAEALHHQNAAVGLPAEFDRTRIIAQLDDLAVNDIMAIPLEVDMGPYPTFRMDLKQLFIQMVKGMLRDEVRACAD